ncbi:hypothetical protein T484DRAFT_1931723 [Baffinella frigidus]|nr:hypothetical protein T484DRAFT_1931723 [Cryptophyta sp. CCMP2293]
MTTMYSTTTPGPGPSDAVTAAAVTAAASTGLMSALFSAVERVDRQKDAHVEAGDAFQRNGSMPRAQQVQFEPHEPAMPDTARSQAKEDSAGDSAGEGDNETMACRVNSSGFVNAVIPRRRGNEKKVVLTRELLESYYHESLDAVTERLGLSKTTIKAACRRLGLPKWPYQHTGPRKRRMGVPKQEQAPESEHERTLKATFHQLMGNTDKLAAYNGEDMAAKRQRMENTHLGPNFVMGQPLQPLPPHTNMVDLNAIQRQSLSALSAMVTALNASGQQLGGLNSGYPGQQPASSFSAPGQQQASSFSAPGQQQAFPGQQALQGQQMAMPLQAPMLNYGGHYGNYPVQTQEAFHQWGGAPGSFMLQ